MLVGRMTINRRGLLALGAGATASAQQTDLGRKLAAAMSAPVLKTGLTDQRVKIESIELLRNGKSYFVRARSQDGAVGYADAHSSVMSAAYPILIKKVAPSCERARTK